MGGATRHPSAILVSLQRACQPFLQGSHDPPVGTEALCALPPGLGAAGRKGVGRGKAMSS